MTAMRIAILWVFLSVWTVGAAQVIEISPPQKTLAKYDDYEILGRNSIGTIVHYYTTSNSHKLEVYNTKMRPFNEVALDFDEKKMSIEKVLLGEDHILIFYTTIENGYEYLKLKKVNYRLDVHREGVVLDSMSRSALNSYQGYYIKPSDDEKHFVAFTFEEKGNRMEVHYVLMDRFQNVVKTGEFWTEDKAKMTIESVKINNEGDLMVVVGHLDRRLGTDDMFSFRKFTVHLLENGASEATRQEITEEGYLYKDLLTNWDEKQRRAILVGVYQMDKSTEDVGIFYTTLSTRDIVLPYTKLPFSEEDFAGSNSPFRRWDDNAEIQRPKRIIPRSDGGFVYIIEGERHDYRLISSIPGATPGNYPYYPDYNNYFDENYFYDMAVVSVEPDGSADWKINLPKIQVTENDRGRYSSFLYCGNNNVVKLLFVDDIYGNGNLTEFDFNPNGKWNKRVLLNSYREELLLVPSKGKQLSGTEVIIPSEKKNRLRLVKINY